MTETPNLTPEAWSIAREVLAGEVGEKPTKQAAARLAGVTVRELNAWITRSRERRETDEPWVWEIAEFYDRLDDTRFELLYGVLWERAVHGVETPIVFKGEKTGETVRKVDTAALVKLMEFHSAKFKELRIGSKTNEGADSAAMPDDLMSRIRAYFRMEQIESEKKKLRPPPIVIQDRETPESSAVPTQPPQTYPLSTPEDL